MNKTGKTLGSTTMSSSAHRLKLLQITPHYFSDDSVVGGGERYVTNLCEALNRHSGDSISSEIVTFSKEKEGRLETDHVEITVLRNESNSTNGFDATNGKLFDLMDGADVIHIHQPFTVCGKMTLLMAKQLRKVVVITDLGLFVEDSFSMWYGADLADLAICISSFAASFLKPYYSGPVQVVSGPLDTRRYVPATANGKKKTQVACVARILPHKGIDRIVRALPAGLDLVVCGRVYDQKYKDYLDSLVKDKSVTFAHNYSDEQILQLYRESLATIMASTYKDCYGRLHVNAELMGFTLLESMAVGTPVLCSRVGGMPELVIDGQTGRVFDSDEQLSVYLSDIKSRTWPPADIGPKCRKHVRERYSMEVVGPRIAKMYQEAYSQRMSAR